VQAPGEALTELSSVTAQATFAESGLPITTTITMAPGDLSVTVEPRGFAPVRLTADDGRISHFPRAWAAVTTGDGRTGVGWVEWNRNLT
jgi:hypothetical protein